MPYGLHGGQVICVQTTWPRRLLRWAAFACCVVAGAVVVTPRLAHAGEEAEHYHLVNTLALAVGFSETDARIIATASWSVDLNDDSTAYKKERHDLSKVLTFVEKSNVQVAIGGSTKQEEELSKELFDQNGLLAHAPKGVMFHSLCKEECRNAVDAYWQRTLAQARSTQERLVMTGMYLHFVVDRRVHPEEAVVGHALENKVGQDPDLAINNRDRFRGAADDVFTVLSKQPQTLPQPVDVNARLKRMDLDTDAKRQVFYGDLVDGLAESYALDPAHLYKDPKKAAGGATQQLRQKVGDRFAKVGESFRIIPIERSGGDVRFEYKSQPDGSLLITDTGKRNLLPKPFSMRDPVYDLRTAPQGNPLNVAKRDVLGQASGFYNEVLIAAAPLVPNVTSVSAKLSVELVKKASEKLNNAGVKAGIVYEKTKESSLRTIQRAEDGSIRVWQREANDILLTEQKAGGIAHAYKMDIAKLAASAETKKVGGVELRYAFDVVASLNARASLGDVAAMTVAGPIRLVALKALSARLAKGGRSREALEEEARNVGGLTRIYGYIALGDDVVLVGSVEPGRSSVRIEDLVLALRSVYQAGEIPAVSLDPDPADFVGPQYAKVFGVPRNTQFARTMLEADYEMKKVMFGVSPVTSADFRSVASLALDQAASAGTGFKIAGRFWLNIATPGPGDVQVSATGDQALFASRIQVLTEAVRMTESGLAGLGTTNPLQEHAARLFTENYQTIAAQYPVFKELEGLGDLVVLSTILRKTGLKARVLSDLANLQWPWLLQVPAPDSYKGVELNQRQGAIRARAAGGAYFRVMAAASKWLREIDPQFALLRDRARQLVDSGKMSLDLDLRVLVVSPTGGTTNDVALKIVRGARYLEAKKFQDAANEFSGVIQVSNGLTEAYLGRALAELGLGNPRRALRDLRRAREIDPTDEDIAAAQIGVGLESGLDLSSVIDPSSVTDSVKKRVGASLVTQGLSLQAERLLRPAERRFDMSIAFLANEQAPLALRGNVRVELAAAATDKTEFDKYAIPAAQDLEKSLRIDAKDTLSLLARSKLNRMRYNYEQAETDAATVIQLQPGNSTGYASRGIARFCRKRFDLAAADFAQAIKLQPNDAAAHFYRGLVLLLQSDVKPASDALKTAAELDLDWGAKVVKVFDAADHVKAIDEVSGCRY